MKQKIDTNIEIEDIMVILNCVCLFINIFIHFTYQANIVLINHLFNRTSTKPTLDPLVLDFYISIISAIHLLSSGARFFHESRRYHTRPLRLNWGPENVHFGKTHFCVPNINVGIFLKNYQAQLFYVLSFPLR